MRNDDELAPKAEQRGAVLDQRVKPRSARHRIRDQERQAVQDLQLSFKGGNLSSEYVAFIRAAEAAFIREVPSTNSTIRKARLMAWAGMSMFDLATLSRALPLLDTHAAQADNEGERSLALKAKALVLSIIQDRCE